MDAARRVGVISARCFHRRKRIIIAGVVVGAAQGVQFAALRMCKPNLRKKFE